MSRNSRSRSPETPDTIILDEIPMVVQARINRDFAILIPDCDQTKNAFSQVAAEALKNDYPWKKYMSISKEQESMQSFSSVTSLSDSEPHSSLEDKTHQIWTGYYRINLSEDMLPPHFTSFGWILGSSRSSIEGADLLLTVNPKRDGIRGRHALLAYDESTAGLWLRVGQRKRVRINGDTLENSQRVCANLETGIEIGRLHYKLRVTDLSHTTLTHQLQHLRKLGKILQMPQTGFELTPTPNLISYRDYVIHPPFASGSFGLVHACFKNNRAEPLVVKRILRNRRTREEIQNEISILQMVGDHPNTCQLVEVFYSGSDTFASPADDAYIFLRPYAETNFDAFRRSDHDEETFLEASAQAARGLAYIHSKNVMHRDIKPTNLLISFHPEITVIVADFGHAIRAQESYDHMKGTTTYLAPETWALKQQELVTLQSEVAQIPYGPKADVWSLACVLVEFRTLGKEKWHPLDFRGLNFHASTIASLKKSKLALDKVIVSMWQLDANLRPEMKSVAGLRLWPEYSHREIHKFALSDRDENPSVRKKRLNE